MAHPRFQPAAFRDIIDYYDKTRFDYQVAWLNDDNLAVHFGFYDRHTHQHADALINTNRIMARLAGIQPGMRVLDAGCGKGGSSLWLARELGVHTVGVTPVLTQVEDARQQAARRGMEDRCEFLQADYCATGLPGGSFDVVWACESLCHAQDKSAFYQEAARLLRPGGRVVLAEYTRYRRPLAPEHERLLLDWLNRWAIPDIDTAAEHESQLQAAGFAEIEIRDYTAYAFISLKNLHQIARRWLWANYILRALRVRSREQHHNITGSVRQFEALRQGLWFYALITAQKA